MSRFNKLGKSTIEDDWETVRKPRTTPKNISNAVATSVPASGGGSNSNEPSIPSEVVGNVIKKVPDDVNENYVPRAIRDELDTILYSSDAVSTKIKNLRDKIYDFIKYKKSRDIDWKTRLNIYIIHRVCKMNKQEILSSIIDSCDNVSKYVNAISSTLSGNTCLFDAIYYGSDQCINVLLNRGANIRHVNKEGETAYNLLETGREHAIKRKPENAKFHNYRYDECLRLIKMHDAERTAQEELDAKIAAGEININKSKDESKYKFTDDSKEKEFLNESDDSKPEEYIKFRDSYDEETMKKDFTTHIENIQDFKDFINHIKEKLKLNDLLKTILEDEDIQDLFEDNPYAKKLC
jgi:hypothetical protein